MKLDGAMKLMLIAVFVLITAGALQGMEPREAEFLQQGNVQLAAGMYQRAANAYERAARINPDSAEALLGMGTSYLKLADNGVSVNPEFLAKAAAALRRALEVNPDLASARYQLGIACLALDDRKVPAENECGPLIRIGPGNWRNVSACTSHHRNSGR